MIPNMCYYHISIACGIRDWQYLRFHAWTSSHVRLVGQGPHEKSKWRPRRKANHKTKHKTLQQNTFTNTAPQPTQRVRVYNIDSAVSRSRNHSANLPTPQLPRNNLAVSTFSVLQQNIAARDMRQHRDVPHLQPHWPNYRWIEPCRSFWWPLRKRLRHLLVRMNKTQ